MGKVIGAITILGFLVAVLAFVVQFAQFNDPREDMALDEQRKQGTELAKQTSLLGEFQNIQTQILALAQDNVELNRWIGDLERRLSNLESNAAGGLIREIDEVWNELARNHSQMQDLRSRQVEIADQLQRSGAGVPGGLNVVEIGDLPPRPDYQIPPPSVYVPPAEPVYVPPAEPVYVPPAEPVYVPPAEPVYVPPAEPDIQITQSEPSRDCSGGVVYGTSSSVSLRNGCAQASWDGCTPVRVLVNDNEVVGLNHNSRAGTVRVCTPGTFSVRIEDANGNVSAGSSITVSP